MRSALWTFGRPKEKTGLRLNELNSCGPPLIRNNGKYSVSSYFIIGIKFINH